MNKFKFSKNPNITFLNDIQKKTNNILKEYLPSSIHKSISNNYSIFLFLMSVLFLILLIIIIKGLTKEGMEDEEVDNDEMTDVQEDENVEDSTNELEKDVLEPMEQEICDDNIKKNNKESKEDKEGILNKAVELISGKENFSNISEVKDIGGVQPYYVDLYSPF